MHTTDRTEPTWWDFLEAQGALIDESLDDSGEAERPIACGLVADWITANKELIRSTLK